MFLLNWIFLLFGSSLLKVNGVSEKISQKRLLLNDPSALLSRIEDVERKMLAMDTQMTQLKSQLDNGLLSHHKSGAVFTRWGRKTCPVVNGTTILYSGVAAGRIYNDKGDGINTLCMPHNPDSAPVDLLGAPNQYHFGRIFGSEYEFSYKNVARNDDVPCAVCYDVYATTSVMIPGKIVCPSHWTKQFDGFLSSGSHYTDQTGGEYLCLDRDPEYATEGARQQDYNGRVFYPVEAVCGSLPCPPYENGKYVSCVVCIK
ncbi:short-chain collagen C4-like [Crassostrea angulata]|uniref:short-chain collagen C4-like n=1 Tax=Magallana angulata TaxID=2784310 RepID=UPI0022B12C9D|nr:short-chain collagen C4-like [Crassostrea angulata]